MCRLIFLTIILIVTMLHPALSQAVDEVIIDNSIGNWVVDRFAGNTKAGAVFYQGAVREVGGLQRPARVVETPDSVYLATHEEGADNPSLYRIRGGMLRLVMEREGLVEGPLELCQGGFPIWNEHDQALYLTGPYCLRKVVIAPDGTRNVVVVAGRPHVAGTADGPALNATLQRGRGWAAAQDGAIYWLEDKALRKFAKGSVSTVPLARAETPGWLWNLGPGEHLLSAGEDANSLYISNFYDTSHGYSILKVDLATNEVRRIIGVGSKHPNHGKETDGPATASAGFRGGARGIYHPGYRAVFLDGADALRYRWWRLEGDDQVRTVFGTLRPGTAAKPFGIREANASDVAGEQFRFGASSLTRFLGIGQNGGVYVGSIDDLNGVWRAYDKTVGSPATPASDATISGGNGSRINAILVASSGQSLTKPMEIAPSASGIQARPRVAFFKGTFLVVWHDLRNDRDFDVLGVRIDSDGKVLDPAPMLIGTGPRTQTMPDVAADDRGFMVVWGGFHDDDRFPHIFAARVDADGTVGPASVIADGASPRIAWSRHEKRHFVLYASAYDSYLSPTINWLLLDREKKAAPAATTYPWVYGGGRDPNRFSVCALPQAGQGWTFVTDHKPGNGWGRSIGVQRAINVTPAGVLSADSPTAATGTFIEKYALKAGGGAANWLDYHYDLKREWPYGANAVAPDGESCVAVWSRYHIGGMTGISLYDSDLYAGRVARWKPVDASPVQVAASTASERDPALAGNGKGSLVAVYEALAEGKSQIVARSLTTTEQLKVGNEVVLTGTAGIRRGFPDIAFGDEVAGVYLVVWQEGWEGESEILEPVLLNPPVRPNTPPPGPAPTSPAPVAVPPPSPPGTAGVTFSAPQSQLVQDGGETPEQIAVFLPGAYPVAATAALRYREVGAPVWIAGHPLFRIRPEFAAGGMAVADGLAWTIFDLTPGTTYEVEVTVHDGAVDTTLSAVMATRALPPPAGPPTRTIAAGSTAAQIQKVFDSAGPGDVIQFSDGRYAVDNLKFSQSGTAAEPIFIRGQSRKGAILDDGSGAILKLDACSHVVVENLTLQGSGEDAGIKPASTAISFWGGWAGSKIKGNVTIRNLTIAGVDRGIDVTTEIRQMLVYDNTLTGNNRWHQDFYAYDGSGAPGSGDGTPDVDQNLFWNDDGIRITGQGNAAFNNTISGFGDALAVEKGYKSVGVHFYRNDIRMSGDDAIEGDYGSRNITFYDNRVHNAMTLVSLDPLWGGPFIAARNIGINIGRQPYKLNSTNSGMFFYNNTVVRTTNPNKGAWGWEQPNNGPLRAWGYQNNILIYQGQGDGLLAMEPSVQAPVDFTHNSWYPDGRVWWTRSGGSFRNLSKAYSSLPQTLPVFSGIPKRHEADSISAANPFVDKIVLGVTHHAEITTLHIPTLAAGSASKNSGTPIIGITDGFLGTAPDRGAIISGRQIPTWGDRSF